MATTRYSRVAVGRLELLPDGISRSAPSGEALLMRLVLSPARRRVPGLLRLGPNALAEEVAWPTEETRQCLQELVDAGVAAIDVAARIIFVKTAVVDDPPRNRQTLIAFDNDLRELPQSVIIGQVEAAVEESIDGDQRDELRAEWRRIRNSNTDSHIDSRVKDDEGIPVAVQIDKAVREWLKRKGVTLETERKRAVTRKRS